MFSLLFLLLTDMMIDAGKGIKRREGQNDIPGGHHEGLNNRQTQG